MRRLYIAVISLTLTSVLAPVPAMSESNSAAERPERGTLDATFGEGGVVVTDLGGLDSGDAIAVGERIVAAGTLQMGLCCDWQLDVALVGYQLDGTIDPSFGDEGVVIADFDQIDRPADMRLDKEGRVLVLINVGDSSDTRGAVLVRYGVDGTLDRSFGDGGIVDVGTDLYPSRIILQSDGKIVITAQSPVVLARYLPDGQPDPEFGENGRVVTSLGTPNDWPIGLAVYPNGKLLVVASTAFFGDQGEGRFHLALVRYWPDGSLDPSFGEEGVVRRLIPDWHDVLDGDVDAEGRIVVLVSGGGGSAYCAPSFSGQKLWRFRRDGRLDTTFDGNGRVRVSSLNARGIALQARGQILVVGEGCPNPENPAIELGFSLARHRSNGSVDGGFGTDGTVVDLIDGRHAVPNELVVQSNARALVVGNTVSTDPFTGDDLAIARYIAA